MAKETVDLVLDTGELVRIECPNRFTDELYETLDHSIKIKERWAPGRFAGCKAVFLGMNLSSVNMARVVGFL